MTKLYISYYGDSVTIVEGSYKKKKFNIEDILFLTSNDIEPNYSDKYNLLKQALKQKTYTTKKAVLCLNTLDVIVKSNKIPRVDAKDLDGLMSLEIDELISLERDQYTFSYEVMREVEEQGEKFLDLILAGIETHEVNTLISIFEEHNLKLDYIDILPASYSRVLKEIEYTDMMIVNTGEYSTSIEIYKEDSLYIHDNVPVRLDNNSQLYEYMRLVDEANGLMNYYSSRNFGKIVDNILIIGTHYNNPSIVEGFNRLFTTNLIQGIDKLYDIQSDTSGYVSEEELNRIVDIIGCMMRDKNKSSYQRMNLLPEDIKERNKQNEKLLKSLKIIPLVAIILYSPIFGLDILTKGKEEEIKLVNSQIEEIKIEHELISEIEDSIKKKEEEIEIYDMLISKEPKWEVILKSIDNNIPYKVLLENLSLSYVPTGEGGEQTEKSEDTNDEVDSETAQENSEEPIYNKVPNFITISGKAQTASFVGQFVYNLKALPYFEDVDLSGVTEQTSAGENKETSYSFSITAKVKEGVFANG